MEISIWSLKGKGKGFVAQNDNGRANVILGRVLYTCLCKGQCFKFCTPVGGTHIVLHNEVYPASCPEAKRFVFPGIGKRSHVDT